MWCPWCAEDYELGWQRIGFGFSFCSAALPIFFSEPLFSPAPVEIPCQDFNAQCKTDVYKNNCHMSGIRKICRVSCGECNPDADKETTTPEPKPACTDEPTCKLITSTVYCERAITRQNCPNLCGTCTTPATEAPVYTTPSQAAPVYTPAQTQPTTQQVVETQPTTPTTIEASTEAPTTQPTTLPTTQASTVPQTEAPTPAGSTAPPGMVLNTSCKDTSANCPAEWCTMPGPKKQAHVRAGCKKTCNFCKPYIPGAASTAATQTSAAAAESSSSQDTCVDQPSASIGCPKSYCTMPGPKKVAYVKQSCRKTCGFCQSSSGSSSSDSSSSSANSAAPAADCKDLKPNYCMNYMRNKCRVEYLKSSLMRDCKKTCNFCGEAAGTSSSSAAQPAAPTCKDNLPQKCRAFKTKCTAKQYANYMKQNCKLTCGHCSADGGSVERGKNDQKMSFDKPFSYLHFSNSFLLSPAPTPAAPSTAGPTCSDKVPQRCKQMKSFCTSKQTKYKTYMAQNCKSTCGFCSSNSSAGGASSAIKKVVPDSSSCVDTKAKYCSSLTKARCNTGKYGGIMKQYCKKTCGHC